MSELRKLDLVPVQSYLAGELTSPTRHEYVGGVVYAMAGASNAHNIVATNALVAMANRLRGGPCRPFNSDTKIRLRLPHEVRFYYSDVSVTCRPNPQSDVFQDEPIVVIEVTSPETRRTDEGEKRDAYLRIPSLSVYVLVEQETARVVVFRRGEQGFAREVHDGLATAVPLPEIGCELPLGELYEGVELRAR